MGEKEKDQGKRAKGKESRGGKEVEEEVKDAEEARLERQHKATLAVLSCFQKLSDVSLENFESVRDEFQEVIKTELPETGAQQDALKEQANRVFEYAQQYVTQIKEQKNKMDDQKEKEEKDEKTH